MAGSSTGRKKSGASSKSGASKSGASRKSTSKSGSPKKSTSKKSSPGKRAGAGSGRGAGVRQEESAVRRDIILIVMFAVTVFLFLCNFMSLGLIGSFFSHLMFGLTGSIAYGLPIFIFAVYLYYFLASHKDPCLASRMAGLIGLLLIVMVLAELVSVDLSSQEGFDPVGIYTRSAENHSGGGLIGGAIAFALYSLLRTVGTVMLLIVLVVACVYLIGQRSYLEMFRDRAMDARLAREERIAEEERYREEHPEEFEDDYADYDGESDEFTQDDPAVRSHYEESRDRLRELQKEREQRRMEKEEERRRQEELARIHAQEDEARRILTGGEHNGAEDVSSWSADLSADPGASWGNVPQEDEIDVPWNFVHAAQSGPQGGTASFHEESFGHAAASVEAAQQTRNPEEISAMSDHEGPAEGASREAEWEQESFRRTEDDILQSVPPADAEPEHPPLYEEMPAAFHESDDLHEIRPEDYDDGRTWEDEILSHHSMNNPMVQEGVPLTIVDAKPLAGDPREEDFAQGNGENIGEAPEVPGDSLQEISENIGEAPEDSGEYGAAPEEDVLIKADAQPPEIPAAEDVPVHTERDGTESEINRTLSLTEENAEEKPEDNAEEDAEDSAGQQVTPPLRTVGSAADAAGNDPEPYRFPPLELLRAGAGPSADSDEELRRTAQTLKTTLQNFGVSVTITDISQGPSVTRYELLPEMGVKVSKIVSLADDIKLALAATDIRIEAPIPGKSAIGIEVPNREAQPVLLRDIIDTPEFRAQKSRISFAVGKDIAGKPVYSDIARMPHVLIAGATGSGKSVCINTIIISILYHANPDEVKFIMIDPKVVELSVYNGIPHLLIPVVTDPQKATAALNWAVAEMEARYRAFADARVREIKAYNALVQELDQTGRNENNLKFMPQIVVIVDELADLMMAAKSDVETAICRLAQLARAAGIHLIIATQRPSVDVITGLIKANMPSRIAFRVSSGVDSRTILDMNGAEKLLGKGDMLFFPQGLPKPTRVQGGFVSDEEVNEVVQFLQRSNPRSEEQQERQKEFLKKVENGASGTAAVFGEASPQAQEPEVDELFGAAGSFIIEKDNASIGLLQRRYRIGFNRAARIMDQLCDAGVVGDSEGTKSRTILMTPAEFASYCTDNGIPFQDSL